MKLCCIVPVKYKAERFRALRRVLDNLQALDCEVIVAEQGAAPAPQIAGLLTNQTHLFLRNEFPFNKSWGLNIAWTRADADLFAFVDADNLIDPRHIRAGAADLADYDFVSPHRKLVDLTEDETDLPFEQIFAIERHGRGELDHQKLPLCGAVTMFRRDALERIGGWPEEFFGWGGEDDAMSAKVQRLLKWKENDPHCYHLYHPRSISTEWYQRNLGILQLYMHAETDELEDHIDGVRPLIGDPDRKFW